MFSAKCKQKQVLFDTVIQNARVQLQASLKRIFTMHYIWCHSDLKLIFQCFITK